MGLMILLTIAVALTDASAEFVPQQVRELPAPGDRVPAPPVPAPEGSGDVAFDNHGNFWTLVPVEKQGHRQVSVLPAQASAPGSRTS